MSNSDWVHLPEELRMKKKKKLMGFPPVKECDYCGEMHTMMFYEGMLVLPCPALPRNQILFHYPPGEVTRWVKIKRGMQRLKKYAYSWCRII